MAENKSLQDKVKQLQAQLAAEQNKNKQNTQVRASCAATARGLTYLMRAGTTALCPKAAPLPVAPLRGPRRRIIYVKGRAGRLCRIPLAPMTASRIPRRWAT